MPPTAVRKAVRLTDGLIRNGPLYPALRARVVTERDVVGALVDVGFARADAEAASRAYDAVAPRLFAGLLSRARETGAVEAVRKLEQPELPAHEAKRLLYVLVRILEPKTVVETGTYNGTFSSVVLQALSEIGSGRLVSLDVPARAAIKHAIDRPLPLDEQPGWIVPDHLRDRFDVILGDTRRTLEPTLRSLGTIEMFLHDSLHTTRHMLFEYRQAWRHLSPNGALVSDDAFMTPAFWWFTRRHGVPLRHIGAMAVTRKP